MVITAVIEPEDDVGFRAYSSSSRPSAKALRSPCCYRRNRPAGSAFSSPLMERWWGLVRLAGQRRRFKRSAGVCSSYSLRDCLGELVGCLVRSNAELRSDAGHGVVAEHLLDLVSGNRQVLSFGDPARHLLVETAVLEFLY